MLVPEGRTVDGFEQLFGVNYLGHFLLTWLLVDTLKDCGKCGFFSCLVSVSSSAHRIGEIRPNDQNTWYVHPSASTNHTTESEVIRCPLESATHYFMSPRSATLPLQRVFNFLAALLRQLLTAVQSHSCSSTVQLMWRKEIYSNSCWNCEIWPELETTEAIGSKSKQCLMVCLVFSYFSCAACIIQPIQPTAAVSWPSSCLVPTFTRNYRGEVSLSAHVPWTLEWWIQLYITTYGHPSGYHGA